MAEGWCRHLKGNFIQPFSAGMESHGLNPQAVKVMSEVAVDISHQQSKPLRDVLHIHFDYVITVCDRASLHCPVFPGKTKLFHVGFDDPPQLAKNSKTEEETLQHYRRVRDEIKKFVQGLPRSLTKPEKLKNRLLHSHQEFV